MSCAGDIGVSMATFGANLLEVNTFHRKIGFYFSPCTAPLLANFLSQTYHKVMINFCCPGGFLCIG